MNCDELYTMVTVEHFRGVRGAFELGYNYENHLSNFWVRKHELVAVPWKC